MPQRKVLSDPVSEQPNASLSPEEQAKLGAFLVEWCSRASDFEDKAGLLGGFKELIRLFIDPSSWFLAIRNPRTLLFEIFGQESAQTESAHLREWLQNILTSGLDSISLELLESLPGLEEISKTLVKSSAVFRERILLLLLEPQLCSPACAAVLARSLEPLLRVRLENFHAQARLQEQSENLKGLYKTAEDLSQKLFYSSELLYQLSEDARTTLKAGAVAILLPSDETRTSFSTPVVTGFPSGEIPLSKALFSKAFEDFIVGGGHAVVYRIDPESFFLVPLFQRGEPSAILLLWSNDPDYVLNESQLAIAEIYGHWLSIAIESLAMFEKVSLSQDEWENTFDSIADPIYIIDQSYRLKKINKSLAALTMKGIKLPPNRDCYRYIFNQSSVCPWCPVPKSLETGQPETVEAALFAGGPWQIQSFPLEDKSEGRIGSIHVLRDMTLLKRMQEQLIESEKLASIGKLISGVAHEVRNPLFGISATVRALANELEGKQEIKPFVDVIMSETGRLNRLMEDLLNYSRPAQIDKNASDLAEIIQEVVQHFKLVSGGYDVEIQFQETEKVPPINVDRNGIKQVLLNLFENGIQHRKGNLHIDVFLEFISLATPPEIQLVVKDNGTGISLDVLPRVFDPFFTTRSKGTGLGLSIVRKVIHDHGGRISVESHPGVGTTFRITLPVTSAS